MLWRILLKRRTNTHNDKKTNQLSTKCNHIQNFTYFALHACVLTVIVFHIFLNRIQEEWMVYWIFAQHTTDLSLNWMCYRKIIRFGIAHAKIDLLIGCAEVNTVLAQTEWWWDAICAQMFSIFILCLQLNGSALFVHVFSFCICFWLCAFYEHRPRCAN